MTPDTKAPGVLSPPVLVTLPSPNVRVAPMVADPRVIGVGHGLR